MAKLFTTVLLAVLLAFPSLLFSQQVTVTAGKAASFAGNGAYFEMLGMRKNKLIVLHSHYESGKDLFALQVYDKEKEYEMVKEEWIDVETNGLTGARRLNFAELVGNKIYIVVMVADDDYTKKKYLATALDLDLETEIEWTELMEVDVPKVTAETRSISEHFVSYSKSDSIIVISTLTFSENKFDFTHDVYDLEFDAIDMEWKWKDLKPELDNKDDKTIDQATDYYSKGKNLSVYLTSPNEKYDTKPSEQSLYFSLYSTSLLVKHDEGKLLDFDDNIYTKETTCYLDSSNNTFVVTGFYNDFKTRKKKPAGVFFIRYDLNTGEVVNKTFTPLSETFSKAYKKSTYRKKHSAGDWGYTFYTTKAPNGDFFISRTFWNTTSTFAYNQSGKVVKNFQSNTGDVIVFRFDSTGTLKGQYFVSKYSQSKKPFDYVGTLGSYIPLLAANNKMFLVFHDNIKNYTEGTYNGKTKKDKGDKKTCLAITEIGENGQGARKVLLSSVEKETGVELYPGAIYKVSDSEYLCYGYKNGTGKIITLKVE